METPLNPVQNVETQVPASLLAQAEVLVQDGWALSLNELMVKALKRYVATHQASMQESFFREDIAWDLHGKE